MNKPKTDKQRIAALERNLKKCTAIILEHDKDIINTARVVLKLRNQITSIINSQKLQAKLLKPGKLFQLTNFQN